ncbi:MAG: hypothetical protein ACXITV_04170 [Luteibaculaceae bacterium]
MRTKSKKINVFAKQLFPSEVVYVEKNNQFADPQYLDVLSKLHLQSQNPALTVHFDLEIDPRKYSRLMANFKHKLEKIDVDFYYQWISQCNAQISMDAILPETEKTILTEIKSFSMQWFHALAFYAMIENYSSYLLFRLRHVDYEKIMAFLQTYQEDIKTYKVLEEQIELITQKIISAKLNAIQLSTTEKEFLDSIFHNAIYSKKLRYKAWLTLNFFGLSNKEYEYLRPYLSVLEQGIFNGEFYSKRILANFYANKLLISANLGDEKTAIFCGYQSIKFFTQDYLFYLNNLCSVLLSSKQFSEALELMRKNLTLYKGTLNNHNKIVFASNYARCLIALKNYQNAARLSANLVEELNDVIFKHRWNYFFRTYLLALAFTKQWKSIVAVCKKYKLIEREKVEQKPPLIQMLWLKARAETKADTNTNKELTNILEALSRINRKEVTEFLQSCSAVLHIASTPSFSSSLNKKDKTKR